MQTSLAVALPDECWIFLPELQGRRSDLRLGIGVRRGVITAEAHWTRADEPNAFRYCTAVNAKSVALVLTFARAAIEGGLS